MKFQLKEKHILKGKRGIRSCPVALALREVLEPFGYRYVSVGRNGISALYTDSDGYAESLKIDDIPKEVSEFIIAFDEYVECLADKSRTKMKSVIRPFEFELDI